jgi:plastocyanin
MEKTTRRHLLKAAAVGGVTATGLSAVFGSDRGIATLGANEQQPSNENPHAHDNRPNSGHGARAVVTFGQWEVDQLDARGPLDRATTPAPPPNRNVHKVLPFEVTIDQGGAVSFIISGFHQIMIYEGRELKDVQDAWAANPVILPPVPPGLVEYSTDRVYRGPSPDTVGPDRVESVNFLHVGRYLVVCGVVPHFREGMAGYVNVKA